MRGTIGIIGTGRMGSALARGLAESGTSAEDIVVYDVNGDVAKSLASDLGATATPTGMELASQADIIILAVKPSVVSETVKEISGAVTSEKLVISIAAGITTAAIEKALPGGSRVVRVMPNAPLQIGKGASAYCPGNSATREDAALVGEIFARFGIAVEVQENIMDAVTGLSGSGPAFFYRMIAAIARGAVDAGMAPETALQLAAQTALGAGAMVLEKGKQPQELIDEVTTPGGTTLAGLEAMDGDGRWSEATAEAVRAAAKRSGELGRLSDKP